MVFDYHSARKDALKQLKTKIENRINEIDNELKKIWDKMAEQRAIALYDNMACQIHGSFWIPGEGAGLARPEKILHEKIIQGFGISQKVVLWME